MFFRGVLHLLDLHWSMEPSTDHALSELLRDVGASIDNTIAGLSNCNVSYHNFDDGGLDCGSA